MVNALFYCGLVMIGVNVFFAPFRGPMKPEIVALPFMCFAAAATGHFLGM